MEYSPKQKAFGGILFSLFMLVAGSLLPLILLKKQPTRNQSAIYSLEVVAVGGLGLQFLIYLMNWSRRPLMLYLVAAAIVVTTVLLATQ